MSKLILWKNQEMDKIRRDMDRLFERCWSGFRIDPMFSDWVAEPRIEMVDRGEFLEVKAYLPGFSAEGLDISVTGNRLAIRGERRSGLSGDEGNSRHPRSCFASFSRVFHLPCQVDADGASASFKDGVLCITIPKKEPGLTCGVKIEVG